MSVKVATYREKNNSELMTSISELRKERFALRMKRSQGEDIKTHRLREIRREIAKIMTVLNEQRGEVK